MNPGVFYFDFFDEQSETSCCYGFNIAPEGMDRIDPESDSFCDLVSELEGDFGVHDWSSSPTDEVEGIGYTSYEVEQSAIPELMTCWHIEIMNMAGKQNVSSNWFDLGDIGNMNDLEIYEKIRSLEEASK